MSGVKKKSVSFIITRNDITNGVNIMVTFKQYLKESVEAPDVYKFYALEYILSAGNKLQFEDYELEKIRKEYRNFKFKVWSDICADGIRAIINETRHANTETNLRPIESDTEEELDRIVQISDDFRLKVMNNPIELNELRDKVNEMFGMSVSELLEKLLDIYTELDWTGAYGGKAWANITREMIDFYNTSPRNIETGQIDHMFDLAHNTDNWLNKFPYGSSIEDALDAKRMASNPHEFKDKIRDRQIRKWLGKALIGTEKTGGLAGQLTLRGAEMTLNTFEGRKMDFYVDIPYKLNWENSNYEENCSAKEMVLKFWFELELLSKMEIRPEYYKTKISFSYSLAGFEDTITIGKNTINTKSLDDVARAFAHIYNDAIDDGVGKKLKREWISMLNEKWIDFINYDSDIGKIIEPLSPNEFKFDLWKATPGALKTIGDIEDVFPNRN